MSTVNRVVMATPVDERSVSPFGRYFTLEHQSGSGGRTTVTAGWFNVSSPVPVLDSPATVGRTRAGTVPFTCSVMERHRGTAEAIVCMQGAIVLAVAPPGPADAPAASDVVALALSEGDVVVMDPGVWHDACRGVSTAADYLWLATSGVSPHDGRWVPVDGGPVTIDAIPPRDDTTSPA